MYAMHLMELSERSSAISMDHKAGYNGLTLPGTALVVPTKQVL